MQDENENNKDNKDKIQDTISSSLLSKPKSPTCFLGLPAEIRRQIYGYVLGGRLIHLNTYDNGPSRLLVSRVNPKKPPSQATAALPKNDASLLSHCLCTPLPHEWHQGEWMKSDKSIKLRYNKPHDDCHSSDSDSMLDLRILRTCTQVYTEAHLLPYSSNLFSFDDAMTYESFLSALTRQQISALRNIHIIIRQSIYRVYLLFNSVMMAGLIPQLHNLEYLRIDLEIGDDIMDWKDSLAFLGLQHYSQLQIRVVDVGFLNDSNERILYQSKHGQWLKDEMDELEAMISNLVC